MSQPSPSFRLCLAAAALSLLTAGPSQAKIFYILQSGPDAWTLMDPSGVESTPDSPVRKAWSVRVQRNILSGDPPEPGYVRTLTEYDCRARATRWREFTAFSRAGGMLVTKTNPQPEWEPAGKAADVHAGYSMVCEGVGRGGVVSAESVAKVVINLMSTWDPPASPLPKAAPTAKTPPAKAAPAAKPAPKR